MLKKELESALAEAQGKLAAAQEKIQILEAAAPTPAAKGGGPKAKSVSVEYWVFRRLGVILNTNLSRRKKHTLAQRLDAEEKAALPGEWEWLRRA